MHTRSLRTCALTGLLLIGCLARSCPAWGLSREALHERHPARYHSLIELSRGSTHAEMSGPAGAPLVVLIHGVSGPMQVWDHTTTALVATGVRVLRYDLYGRGFSSRLPAGTQHDLDLYVAQLEELLATLQEHRSLVLVGSSMGAIVASEFALRHPAQVAALALVGPAGFPIEVPFLARLRELPIVGDWLSRWLGREAIVEQNRRYFHREEARARFLPYFVDQLEVDGSVEAILSTMRHVPVDDYLTSYRALDALGFPVLVLWGRHDATFPFHSAALLAGAAPGFHIVPVEEAAHLPQYERPEVVNPLLAAFVQDHLAP